MTRLTITGFGIWLIATVALRAWGERVLVPDSAPAVAVLLAVSVPAMFYLPLGLFHRFAIDRAMFAQGAIALVAPGMFLDTCSAIWFPHVFPNIRPDAAGLFAGWLLLCNAVALVSAAAAARHPPR